MDFFIVGVVIFFTILLINGAVDFLSKVPHTPLGAFIVIVAAIPIWIFFKTIFIQPPDEEIRRDWNRYAALLTVIIFVILAVVAFFIIGAVIFG